LRSQQLATAIVRVVNRELGTAAGHLRGLFRDRQARRLSIAEINSAGRLHRYLRRCRGLRYSEYRSRKPWVRSENLTRLSYADASFDLVTTSDVLEHVPDVGVALREIYRVLRPGASHVFTVPIVWDRPTRQRAELRGGRVVHLLAPSYHGSMGEREPDFLVFHEFGGDFVDRVKSAGFEVELMSDESNRALVTLIARRPS